MFSNITFKHRLIGVIFLVSLAVIVIPAIFDTPTVDTLSGSESLPLAPTHAALQELDKIEYAFSELTQDLPVQEPVGSEPEMVVMPAQESFEPEDAAVPEVAQAPEPAVNPAPINTPVNSAVTTPEVKPAPAPAVVATTTTTSAPAPATISIPARGEITPAPAATTTASVPATTPAQPSKVIAHTEKLITDNAWAVQLGAFSKVSNAQSLLKELQAKGYNAYIEHMASTNLTRVLVGTRPDRQQATELLTELNNTMQIKGIVVKFNPQNAG